jgi:LysR family transcriptional regulator (chromosome initiation inhibitor)
VARHFPHGVDAAALAAAPMVVFNRKDALQWRFVRRITRARLAPPTHYLPSSTGFVDAAAMGLGWCMAPESMLRKPLRERSVQAIAPDRWLDVPLYWQHWSVRSATLDRLTDALLAAARNGLRERPVRP